MKNMNAQLIAAELKSTETTYLQIATSFVNTMIGKFADNMSDLDSSEQIKIVSVACKLTDLVIEESRKHQPNP